MNEYYVLLVLIIFSELFACMLVIHKRNKLIAMNTGLEIGEIFPDIKVYNASKTKEKINVSRTKIIFFDINCGECKMILDGIKNQEVSGYFPVTYGEMDEVYAFCKKNNYNFTVGCISEFDMYSTLSIYSFPFRMDIENGVVKNKEFTSIRLLKRQAQNEE